MIELHIQHSFLAPDALDAVYLELLLPEHLLLHIEQRNQNRYAFQAKRGDDAFTLDGLLGVVDHEAQIDLVEVLLQSLCAAAAVVDLFDLVAWEGCDWLVENYLIEGFVDNDVRHSAHW